MSTRLPTIIASEYEQMVPHVGDLHLLVGLCREGLAVYRAFRGCIIPCSRDGARFPQALLH